MARGWVGRAAHHLKEKHRVTDAVQLLPGLLVLLQHLGPLVQGIHDHLHLAHSILLPLLQRCPHLLLLLLQIPHQVPEALLQDSLLIGGETLDVEEGTKEGRCQSLGIPGSSEHLDFQHKVGSFPPREPGRQRSSLEASQRKASFDGGGQVFTAHHSLSTRGLTTHSSLPLVGNAVGPRVPVSHCSLEPQPGPNTTRK